MHVHRCGSVFSGLVALCIPCFAGCRLRLYGLNNVGLKVVWRPSAWTDMNTVFAMLHACQIISLTLRSAICSIVVDSLMGADVGSAAWLARKQWLRHINLLPSIEKSCLGSSWTSHQSSGLGCRLSLPSSMLCLPLSLMWPCLGCLLLVLCHPGLLCLRLWGCWGHYQCRLSFRPLLHLRLRRLWQLCLWLLLTSGLVSLSHWLSFCNLCPRASTRLRARRGSLGLV